MGGGVLSFFAYVLFRHVSSALGDEGRAWHLGLAGLDPVGWEDGACLTCGLRRSWQEDWHESFSWASQAF